MCVHVWGAGEVIGRAWKGERQLGGKQMACDVSRWGWEDGGTCINRGGGWRVGTCELQKKKKRLWSFPVNSKARVSLQTLFFVVWFWASGVRSNCWYRSSLQWIASSLGQVKWEEKSFFNRRLQLSSRPGGTLVSTYNWWKKGGELRVEGFEHNF